MANNKVFEKYSDILDAEHGIRQKINTETKALDKITWRINVQLEALQDDLNRETINNMCASVRECLSEAPELFRRISDCIPPTHYYKYATHVRHANQRLVQVVALMVYLQEDRLVTLEEASRILGLKPADFSVCRPYSSSTDDARRSMTIPSIPVTPDTKLIIVKTEENKFIKDIPKVDFVYSHTLTGASNIMDEQDDCIEEATNLISAMSADDREPAQCEVAADATQAAGSPCTPERSQGGVQTLLSCTDSGTNIILTAPTPIPAPLRISATVLRSPNTSLDSSQGPSTTDTSLEKSADASPEPTQPLLSLLSLENSVFLDLDDFLLGVLGMTSELARLSVNAVTAGNYDLPFKVNKFLRQLHSAYSLLNLKNGFLRKSFDELKYSLKKVEDVVYNLSLRNLGPNFTDKDSDKPMSFAPPDQLK